MCLLKGPMVFHFIFSDEVVHVSYSEEMLLHQLFITDMQVVKTL